MAISLWFCAHSWKTQGSGGGGPLLSRLRSRSGRQLCVDSSTPFPPELVRNFLHAREHSIQLRTIEIPSSHDDGGDVLCVLDVYERIRVEQHEVRVLAGRDSTVRLIVVQKAGRINGRCAQCVRRRQAGLHEQIE